MPYLCGFSAIMALNAPLSGSYHSLLVMKSDSGNYVQQFAIKESTTDAYLRYYNGSSWSSWKKIMMSGDSVSYASSAGSASSATSATKLSTARKIAGHNFDGTSDIDITAQDVGAWKQYSNNGASCIIQT